MRKIVFFVVLALACVSARTASAQLKFGLKGGVNITRMSFGDELFEADNRSGFFIGPTVKFGLPVVGLGIDVSALYDQREAKFKDAPSGYEAALGRTVKQKAINIPVNLRYDVGLGSLAGVYLAAGPQFGFNIGDRDVSLIEDVSGWRLAKSVFSVNVGAGVMLLGHLQVGANYNIVCGKTGDVTFMDGLEGAMRGRCNSWQVSAAYYF